jgi:uncharacterized protein (TIGR01777 family)
MRTAIVGATGLIGRRLIRQLVARGDDVVALVRGGKNVEGARVIAWDPTAGPVPPGAFDGCDAVVNLAGSPIGRRWNAQVKREIASSRIDLTDAVVRAVADPGPRVLVNASAVGYYGNRDEVVDESATPGSGFLADICRRWEAAATAATSHGVRVVLLRTGVVLAAEGGALPQMVGPTKLGLGGPIAGGRQWFPWIHVDDVVGLILHSLDQATLAGPVNLVAPGILQQGEFAKELGHAVHRPAATPTPGFAIKLRLGEGAQIVLQGQHAVPRVALASGYAFRFAEASAALADLIGEGEGEG